jgi:subfamily B ATP-binding cassette protein MsbA
LTIVGEEVHLDVRQALFEHLQKLPIGYFDNTYTGRIMARITTDCDALWHLAVNGITNILAPAISIVVVLAILFTIHVKLTLMTLILVPLLAMLYQWTRKKVLKYGLAQREVIADIYTKLAERINNIRLIRIFGRGAQESLAFSKQLRELYDRNVEMVSAHAILGSSSVMLTDITTALVLCLGGMAVIHGSLTAGDLIAFYLYARMLFSPLENIVRSSTKVFTDAEVAMTRIFELLDTPVARELHGLNRSCPRLQGNLLLDAVSFAYTPDNPVLQEISLTIEAGQRVALVGPSGGGKTTLVNLICRFYHPTAGRILADGHDIADFEIESFRGQIGYVFQDNFLFSGSIASNLRFAKADASDAEIEEACRRANAHEFIARLHHGYHTEIGERGVRLSGGQKQRLNLARVLMRNPSVLILDEPTSALDAESESVILEALDTIFRDKTCIIIAHRLTTVMSADRIFVIDKGQLVQQGDHKSLLGSQGLYRELCRKQFVGFGGIQSVVEDEDDPLVRAPE